jgi:hypothetical protein
MSSIRRINASRANGARSRGPITEPGKQISSQNARRHALLARCVVLQNESPEAFESVLNEHLERFQPADGVEFGIVEEMVAAWWRMRRAWTIETSLLSEAFDVPEPGDGPRLLAAAFKNIDDSHGLALLHRYETRLHCMYQRGLRNLQLLRATQAPNEPSPTSEHLPPPAPEPPPEPAPAAESMPEPLAPQPVVLQVIGGAGIQPAVPPSPAAFFPKAIAPARRPDLPSTLIE